MTRPAAATAKPSTAAPPTGSISQTIIDDDSRLVHRHWRIVRRQRDGRHVTPTTTTKPTTAASPRPRLSPSAHPALPPAATTLSPKPMMRSDSSTGVEGFLHGLSGTGGTDTATDKAGAGPLSPNRVPFLPAAPGATRTMPRSPKRTPPPTPPATPTAATIPQVPAARLITPRAPAAARPTTKRERFSKPPPALSEFVNFLSKSHASAGDSTAETERLAGGDTSTLTDGGTAGEHDTADGYYSINPPVIPTSWASSRSRRFPTK